MTLMNSILVQGVRVPGFMYGTAWKEERTAALVSQALAAGFRSIDTANQRKHYHEAGVGAGLAASAIPREELFLQTKFTYQRGQDARLPYDPHASLGRQVEQSFESSLAHLGVSRIDSYVLHGPWAERGWTPQDREVWAAMEAQRARGRLRLLGVSNVSLPQLASLCEQEAGPPAFVQNRCYARNGWDRELRRFCKQHGIVYQGFSLLTANRRELASAPVLALAHRLGASVPQLVFRFASALGMLPLTGTSDVEHMRQDLQCASLALEAGEIAALEDLARSSG